MSRGIRTSRHLDPWWERPQGLISTECFPCMSYTLALLTPESCLDNAPYLHIYSASTCASTIATWRVLPLAEERTLDYFLFAAEMSRRNDPYSSPTNLLFSSRYVCWERRVKLGIRRSSPLSFFSTGSRKFFSTGWWRKELGNGNGWNLIGAAANIFQSKYFLEEQTFLKLWGWFLHFLAALLKSLLLQMSSSLRGGKCQPSSWIISSFKSPPLSFASRQHSQLLCKSLLRKNIKQLANNIPSEDAAWISQSICFISNSNT